MSLIYEYLLELTFWEFQWMTKRELMDFCRDLLIWVLLKSSFLLISIFCFFFLLVRSFLPLSLRGVLRKLHLYRSIIIKMITQLYYENSSEVGVFSKLTNKYCLVGESLNENFYGKVYEQLNQYMPVVKCSISNTRIIGWLCAGNKNGLLLPPTTTDQEL